MNCCELPTLEDLKKACPKCGEGNTLYNYKLIFCEGLTEPVCPLGVVGEHLHLKCDKCGFTRPVICKDAEPVKATEETKHLVEAASRKPWKSWD